MSCAVEVRTENARDHAVTPKCQRQHPPRHREEPEHASAALHAVLQPPTARHLFLGQSDLPSMFTLATHRSEHGASQNRRHGDKKSSGEVTGARGGAHAWITTDDRALEEAIVRVRMGRCSSESKRRGFLIVHVGDERVDISHSQCSLLELEFPHKFIHSMGGRNELHLVLPVLPGLQTYPVNSCPRTQDLLIEDHFDETWAVVRTHHAVYPIPKERPYVICDLLHTPPRLFAVRSPHTLS